MPQTGRSQRVKPETAPGQADSQGQKGGER